MLPEEIGATVPKWLIAIKWCYYVTYAFVAMFIQVISFHMFISGNCRLSTNFFWRLLFSLEWFRTHLKRDEVELEKNSERVGEYRKFISSKWPIFSTICPKTCLYFQITAMSNVIQRSWNLIYLPCIGHSSFIKVLINKGIFLVLPCAPPSQSPDHLPSCSQLSRRVFTNTVLKYILTIVWIICGFWKTRKSCPTTWDLNRFQILFQLSHLISQYYIPTYHI